MRKEYKRLSRRTRQLLSGSEGVDVEFKREIAGVKHKTLIAFANSRKGGAILIGIDEYTSDDGLQRGLIVGCDVSDHARLQIQNMAVSCLPPIQVFIVTENTDDKPLLRVEVPSGQQRPYCSPSGEYSIRADGRNRALLRDEMLQIFIERESEQFVQRFKHAVSRLENQLTEMDHELRGGVDKMLGDITRLDQDTAHLLQDLYGRSEDLKEETEHSRRHDEKMERVIRKLKHGLDHKYKELARRLNEVNSRLDAILKHLDIDDPIQQNARKHIVELARQIDRKDSPALLAEFVEVMSHIYPELEKALIERWVSEAIHPANPGLLS
ncbi:MAG: putative DNA binding domain-containing protein [Hahellaceae bacterium]|nr:putative DNA binding domain-containing protein [Hahellaceae bacterium]